MISVTKGGSKQKKSSKEITLNISGVKLGPRFQVIFKISILIQTKITNYYSKELEGIIVDNDSNDGDLLSGNEFGILRTYYHVYSTRGLSYSLEIMQLIITDTIYVGLNVYVDWLIIIANQRIKNIDYP